MKIDESCIDHNVMRIIANITGDQYELIDKDERIERELALMTLSEIGGVLEMAKAMKEVLEA